MASKAANLELASELLHRIVGGIGGGRHDHRANALAGRDSLDQPSQDWRSARVGEHPARGAAANPSVPARSPSAAQLTFASAGALGDGRVLFGHRPDLFERQPLRV